MAKNSNGKFGGLGGPQKYDIGSEGHHNHTKNDYHTSKNNKYNYKNVSKTPDKEGNTQVKGR